MTFQKALLCCIILIVYLRGHGTVGVCGPAVAFYAMEKQLMEEQNITADKYCTEFDNKEDCKNNGEYINICNWCDQHKPVSQSTDTSVRCVTASYHWNECQRQIAPPRKERMKHKFDWDISKSAEASTDREMRDKSDYDESINRTRNYEL
mmetsp:Transcript_4124/g.9259  ORF Transcript_4124/g.9259 Transcript_4124/m.9259 type:complete len:150 (-) Transcript_4124:618-1067(-)